MSETISETNGLGVIYLDDLRSRKRVLTPEEVKSLYTRICKRAELPGVRSGDGWMDVRALEIAIHADFKDTADFHCKVKTFLEKGRARSAGYQLKRARTKMKWTQKQLAQAIKCSQAYVAQMEKDEKPISKEAVEFVELTNYPIFDRGLIIKQLQARGQK